MAKPLIVLADPDETYLAALECRFLEGSDDTVDIEVISDEGYLLAFASDPHDIEAMIVAECWYGGYIETLNMQHVFVLTERRDDEGAGAAESTCDLSATRLFKFSALDLIYNKVMSECVALRKDDVVHSTTVVLCHTPVGGAGTTTIALAIASALDDMYKRVLYVDAEHVQSFTSYLANGKLAGTGMARDMARMSGDAFSNMHDHIVNDGFDYIPPLRSGLASCGVDPSFFERFVASAKASARYDYIVVDSDGRFDERKACLLALADRVVMPVTQDVHALHKVMKFRDNIDGSEFDGYHFVCNKYRKGEGNAFASDSGGAFVALDAYVEYDPAIPDMDAHALGQVSDFKKIAYALA